MTLRFRVAPSSPTPIYRQIVEQVRAAVATGQVEPGAALPSVRSLATELVVNPNTVAKAYSELCRDGVAVSERGKGVFIAEAAEALSADECSRRLKPFAESIVREALLLGLDRDGLSGELDKYWPPKGEAKE